MQQHSQAIDNMAADRGRIAQEVGFQRVHTYGDFEAEFEDNEPDFLVHVAEKGYEE